MSDYIKREDAIKAIDDIKDIHEDSWLGARYALKHNIPSADVVDRDKAQKEIDYWHDKAQSYEQTIVKLTLNQADVRENVRGEWLPDMIYDGEDEWCFVECSNCKYRTDKHYNFCPNCGADMRGDNND